MDIDKLDKRIAALAAERKKVVAETQATCKHKRLAECDYQPSPCIDGSALAPMRICLDCRLSEEGWGPGYVVLKGNAEPTSRSELYKLRRGLMLWGHHKGPLLRKETTVAQLVAMENTDHG